jgi:hypothetical protein
MQEIQIDVNEETLDGFTENPQIEMEPLTTDEPTSSPTVTLAEETGEDPGVKIIGTIKSSAYGGFTKIISLLTGNMGKSDIISIEEGKLSTISGGGFLYCDLGILFGENNFDIIDPQYSIKLMKLISGGDEVTFIDDDVNSRYLISNLVEGHPQITITLPKPDPSMNPKITKPNLGELQEALENIDPDLVNTITTAEKNLDSQYFILTVAEVEDKHIITSISTDKETFKFQFKDSWASDDTSSEPAQYKLFNPFPIPKPEEIELKIYKSEAGELWVHTVSEVGMAKIEYMEKLTPMGVYDTFSF